MNRTRLLRAAEKMKDLHVSQMLVTAPASICYFTGAWIEPGERMLALVVRDDGSAVLIANRLFAVTGVEPLAEFDDIDDPIATLSGFISPGKLGVDKTWPSGFLLRLMDARRDVEPILVSAVVDDCRMVKDREELELMREASRLNDLALNLTISRLKLGMTEREASRIYSECAVEVGGEGPSFEPLICFSKNCAEPHHACDDTRLESGNTIICDVGLKYKNYCSDMTRTVFWGKVTDEQEKVYSIVKAANEAGRAAVRPGEPMRAFDHAARKVIEDAGYGEYFTHRTGHGIGLEVHEYPDNSAVSETVAQPGMVFSVEPGIYLPGKFGVRVEDLVEVTKDGARTLNDLDRRMRIL